MASTPYHRACLLNNTSRYCFPLQTSLGSFIISVQSPNRFKIYRPDIFSYNDKLWMGYKTSALLCRDKSWRFGSPSAFRIVDHASGQQTWQLFTNKGPEKVDLEVILNIICNHFVNWWERHQDEAILAGLKFKSRTLSQLMQFDDMTASQKSRRRRQIQEINRQLLNIKQNRLFDERNRKEPPQTDSSGLMQLLNK